MDDLISRQAAIGVLHEALDRVDQIADVPFGVYQNYRDKMNELPSAQLEIIRCKDCKHFVRDDIEEYTPYGFYNTYFHAFCDKHWDNEQGEFIDVKIDDFCSFAERREVTT